mmetsp:Transcript_112717/g.323900  ORF Transcript_112717/g.323900 Transcript_112717/m.323900 type:complete len:965 (+) Transcript_112717:1-2895(+)
MRPAFTRCRNEARSLLWCICLLAVRSAGRVVPQARLPSLAQSGGHRRLFVDALRKPPKIRGADINTREEDSKTPQGSVLECGVTHKVNARSSKYDICPEECPLFAQDRTDKSFCTFSCVPASQCRAKFVETPIGDTELGICRGCMLDGCDECDHSADSDRCAACKFGYKLLPDGTCQFKYIGPIFWSFLGVLGFIAFLLFLWVVDMAMRPISNPKGLAEGIKNRENTKIHQPHRNPETGKKEMFPFGTNVHTTLVAGPGMLLHFNFQLAVILWAIFVASVWMSFAAFVDEDLWRLGTRRYGTPRENCILVAWGYETQHRLMWAKVGFLWIVYIGTCLAAMAYGVYQLRRYQSIDYQTKTMKDFAALLVGLPSLPGTRALEEDLKTAIARWSGLNVLGVSVAWNHKDEQKKVEALLKQDLDERLIEMDEVPSPTPRGGLQPPAMNPVRRWLWNKEKDLLGLEPVADEGHITREEAKALLLGLTSAKRAVVVFETEEARDKAIAKSEADNGIVIEDFQVTLSEMTAEPDTVEWENFGHITPQVVMWKVTAGFGIISLACLFWAVVFYAPYAYYVLTFNYANGRQPGFVVGMSFSMIVVVGNAIMYEVCARISDWVGFRFRDEREVCYMILYTIACMFNVILDFVTTYITAEIILDTLGFRTYFGEPLRDIKDFTDKFETYGMQRSLAENTFTYAFPSTFLIPFLIEWLPTIALPYALGKFIVKSHPEVRGLDAEGWLQMLPMDMGRYADLLLNMILGILIFYFPGGYTWTLFLGMAGSHAWIYAFDYYKVLRQIPAVNYVEHHLEWWCQILLAPIFGIIASSLLFKSNCEPGYHCVKGWPIVIVCFCAWLAHVVVHVSLVVYVLPMFGVKKGKIEELAGVTYKDCGTYLAATWFNTNPVHCLRSKYFYEDEVSVDFYRLGKENTIRENPQTQTFLSQDQRSVSFARRVARGESPRLPQSPGGAKQV